MLPQCRTSSDMKKSTFSCKLEFKESYSLNSKATQAKTNKQKPPTLGEKIPNHFMLQKDLTGVFLQCLFFYVQLHLIYFSHHSPECCLLSKYSNHFFRVSGFQLNQYFLEMKYNLNSLEVKSTLRKNTCCNCNPRV